MAKEMDIASAEYAEARVVPVAVGSAGEILSFNALTGQLIEDITAAEVALSESRTLIFGGNIAVVAKTTTQVWVAGEPLYFDPATGKMTNVPALLKCVGYVYEAALSAAISGSMILMGTPQAGNGKEMRSGITAVTGTELSIDTGLALIVHAIVSVKIATQAINEIAYVTYDHGADGLLDLYAWDDAGVAATVAGDVCWVVFGN